MAGFVNVFFFKQKTAYEVRISDWSSDVCSSDLTREDYVGHTNVAMAGEVPVANLYHPDWNDLGTLSYGRNGAGSRGRTDTQSLYAFDTLKFGAHFMVSGGVRIDHYKTDYLATAACNTEGTGTDSRRPVYCNGAAHGTVPKIGREACREKES